MEKPGRFSCGEIPRETGAVISPRSCGGPTPPILNFRRGINCPCVTNQEQRMEVWVFIGTCYIAFPSPGPEGINFICFAGFTGAERCHFFQLNGIAHWRFKKGR